MAIGPLTPRTDGSTPGALEMSVLAEADVYRVRVQTYVRARGVLLETPCQEADLWRVGPHAVNWPPSSAFRLPLRYSAELPDGLYDEQIDLRVLAYDFGVLSGVQQSTFRPFEVVAGALHPLPASEYGSRLSLGAMPGSLGSVARANQAAPTPPPCSTEPVTDETDLEAAVSTVDFDAWHGAGSLQPVRLNTATWTLQYQTTAPNDLALKLRLQLSADITSGAVSVPLERSSLMLAPPMPRSRDEIWNSLSGTAIVRPLADGRLVIELSDVVMENEFDATLKRSVPSGSIIGIWSESP